MADDSWDERFSRIGSFYDELVEEHGSNPKSRDYGSLGSQQIKFKTVAEVMPLDGKRVLDIGCGLGEFSEYLNDKYGCVDYVGVDISDEMITKCKALRPNLDIQKMNILESAPQGPFDLVTANGIFYLLGDNAWDATKELIARMFELSQEAVAFTSLSTWADWETPGRFYADPFDVLTYCRTFTKWVALKHDYLPHDFTIYMYKNARSAEWA